MNKNGFQKLETFQNAINMMLDGSIDKTTDPVDLLKALDHKECYQVL